MKKSFSLVTVVYFILLSFTSYAQTKPATDFFPGRWDVLLQDLPQGDPRMIVGLQRKDGKLEGTIMDSTRKEIAKISQIEEKDSTVKVYFSAQGYDVWMEMVKKDEESITVNLLGMFEGKGVRVRNEVGRTRE